MVSSAGSWSGRRIHLDGRFVGDLGRVLSTADRGILRGPRNRREHDDLDRGRASAWQITQDTLDGVGVMARAAVPLAGRRRD